MEREFYLWTSGGATVSAALTPDLITRLRETTITPDGTEVGGILLGRCESDTRITIEDFEVLPSEHRRGITFTLSQADRKKLTKRLDGSHHGLQTVGSFRTHLRHGLYMDHYDQELMTAHFAGSSDVMLLIRPSDWVAGMFVWEDGDIRRQKSYREFPFDVTQLSFTPVDLPQPARPSASKRLSLPALDISRFAPHKFLPALPTLAKVGLIAATFGLVGVLAFYAHHHTSATPATASFAKLSPADQELQPPQTTNVAPPYDPDVVSGGQNPDELHVKLPEETRPSPFTAPAQNTNSTANTTSNSNRPLRTFVPPPTAAVPLPVPPPVEAAANIPPSVLDVVKLKPSPPQVVSIVSLEPAAPGLVSRSINRVPVLNLLQRHKYKAGDNFSQAVPVRQVKPRLPLDLQHDGAYSTPIDVKVWIDDSGLVTKALVLSEKSPPDIADFAAHAALKWTFRPAHLSDRAVSSEMVMHFRFEPKESY